MRELSLFTGAGGGLLGSMLLGWELTAAVEWDAYCQRVLCARGGYMADAASSDAGSGTGQQQGSEPADGQPSQPVSDTRHRSGEAESGPVQFPVYSDVRTFDPTPGSCDIVTGGFPCQPFSQAGKRLGEDDPRNMWPHAVRVLVESGAPLGFFENVPGLLSSGYFGTVLGDLAEVGFDAEWCVLGADDVGAPHRRKRLWILAVKRGLVPDAISGGCEPSGIGRGLAGVGLGDGDSPWRFDPADVAHGDGSGREERRRAESVGAEHGAAECGGEAVADPEQGVCGRRSDEPRREPEERVAADGSSPCLCDSPCGGQPVRRPSPQPRDERHAVCPDGDGYELEPWQLEPYVGRVAAGVPKRVDRLRALGNAQVPQCMAAAFTYLAACAGIPAPRPLRRNGGMI